MRPDLEVQQIAGEWLSGGYSSVTSRWPSFDELMREIVWWIVDERQTANERSQTEPKSSKTRLLNRKVHWEPGLGSTVFWVGSCSQTRTALSVCYTPT